MKALVVLLLCSITACTSKRPVESSHEIAGSQAERIAAVSKLITKHSPLPSPLLDANFIEEQTGDGRLGPSDFTSFCAVSVAAADALAWRAALAPLEEQNTPPKYAAPKDPVPWWLPSAEFLHLEFHSPNSLTGCDNGWVGIDLQHERIYIYSFTM